MSSGPDFICIGMPKAGTGWLYDQVQYHPDFWMPPVKEIDYLSFEYPKLKHVFHQRQRLEKRSKLSGHRRRGDSRDLEFLTEACSHAGEPMQIERYATLFRHKNGLLSGDVSPGYSRLEGEVIATIAEHLPDAKIVLLVRDPVARAWSHISLLYRMGKFDTGILADPDRFRSFLENPKNIRKRSFPSVILDRWRSYAPRISFRYFFFDDIEANAEGTRREILSFVGADPDKSSGEMPAAKNRKAAGEKLVLAESSRAVLVSFFAEELKACSTIFGGPARKWAAQYSL